MNEMRNQQKPSETAKCPIPNLIIFLTISPFTQRKQKRTYIGASDFTIYNLKSLKRWSKIIILYQKIYKYNLNPN